MVKTTMNSLYEKIDKLQEEVQTIKDRNVELLECTRTKRV